MSMQNAGFLPVEVIFNLLSVCRRGFSGSSQAMRAAVHRRGLFFGNYRDLPRLSFWIQLCRSASLLDESWPPYPTLFASEWFAYPLENQIWTLVRAWVSAPRRKRQRRLREHLLDRLLNNSELSQTYRRELTGLRTIGICAGETLTPLGRAVVGERQNKSWCDIQVKSWSLLGERLLVDYPPKWGLLWQLEAYLDPIAPGLYLITPETLRKAVQKGALDGRPETVFITILEKGLEKNLPDELVEALAATPGLRVLPGPVLEFDDPQELIQLREKASFCKDFHGVISPRHVHLDPWRAPRVLRNLYRQELISRRDLEMAVATHPLFQLRLNRNESNMGVPAPAQLTNSERQYLLSLLLVAEGLKAGHSPPPGLLLKLTKGMEQTSRAAAARKASELLNSLDVVSAVWLPETELPPEPEGELITYLEQAIIQGDRIDVLYQGYGKDAPEYRHLTPLLVEQRGTRYYLLAYCHQRRANRTFRLDRLRLIDSPP